MFARARKCVVVHVCLFMYVVVGARSRDYACAPVALLIQNARRRDIFIYFSKLSHKWHDFHKKNLRNIKRVF